MNPHDTETSDDSRKLRRTIQRLHAQYGEQINTLTREKIALTAEVERLLEDQQESDELRERMAELLDGVAKALKGDPGPLVMHDWSDLSTVAAAAVADRDRLAAQVAAAYRYADEMAGYCSPHGVAHTYAQRLREALDNAKTA